MKPPKHIRDLRELGRTDAELKAFREALAAHRITCGYHPHMRVWILGHVPSVGATFISLRLGAEAFAAMLDNPAQVIRDFEQKSFETTIDISR